MRPCFDAAILGLTRLGSPLLDLFFPVPELRGERCLLEEPFCERCGHPYWGEIDGPFRCTNCGGRVCHYAKARAQYLNRGAVREAVHAFKYAGEYWLRRMLGEWIVEGFERHYADMAFDMIVPVPLHPSRFRWRGFNQAEELAKVLSSRMGVPLVRGLRRLRDTGVQAAMGRRERWTNVRGAFGLAGSGAYRDTRVLLVDDVFTTGSTVNECARQLRRAGALSVHVIAVARG
ncbi:MAG TPA: ComF family protein [Verrucomicrobiae bacterium]|nr:ComF family protein [Verrucomicrobiae bacterium]